jgi:hypothetical protein
MRLHEGAELAGRRRPLSANRAIAVKHACGPQCCRATQVPLAHGWATVVCRPSLLFPPSYKLTNPQRRPASRSPCPPHDMLLHVYHLVALVASALLSAGDSPGTCYYPNGNSSAGLIPCNQTAAESHCCRSADVCLTNKLCFSPGLNAIVRRGCTDMTWKDPACPQVCLTGNRAVPGLNTLCALTFVGDDRQADVVLTICDTYNSFCCGQDDRARACCDSGNGTVRLTAAEIMLTSTSQSPTATATATNFTCPSTSPQLGNCTHEMNRSIGLGAALGVLTVVLAAVSVDWWNKRNMLKARRPVMT